MPVPKTHPYDFDPTGGMRIDDLLAIEPPPAPEDFDAFWAERYLRALKVNPRPVLAASALDHPDWVVSDIVYTSTCGVEIGGWLLVPRHGCIRRGLVVGHGYGGRDQPQFDIPVAETAVLFPCFRGLSRSARPDIPEDAAEHVLAGIDSREGYVIGGCVEDLWGAVSALVALFPEVSGRIGYSGISFGGGIGALAIPFDNRIDRGFLEVPTFGHRPLWLTLPALGSAQSVQQYFRLHPEVAETLRYFDAAIAASRITVPMLVAPALFDPAVAPPCQFAVANALRKFNRIFTLDAGHFDYAEAREQQELLRQRIEQLFRV